MSVLVLLREEVKDNGLTELARKIALSRDEDLYILRAQEGSGMPELTWTAENENSFEANLVCVNTKTLCKKALETLKPSLLVMQRSAEHSFGMKQTVNELMVEARCEVLVMRMAESDQAPQVDQEEDLLEKILVPCSGGRHSLEALKLAHQLVGDSATALFVEPEVDEVSESVGFAHLHRYIKRAGLKPEEVRCHVELGDQPFEGIHKELKRGYGMMILGASVYAPLSKKWFGAIPKSLMSEEKSTSIGVLRAEKPLGHQFNEKFERLLHLNVPQLRREERVALFDQVEEKSRWSFDFAVLMVLATSIAALGLLADSGAVVIGAMLVAPLMMPLLGGGLSLVQGNWPLWKRCQKAVLLGFLSALGIGVLLGIIARLLGMPMTSQLLARGEPSTLDLGVAFVSGIAASYCLARPKLSSALAGVAIAAALVPPIATTGISLALGEFKIAQGAALLFGTNVVAIVFGAAVNFFIAGIRGKSSISGVWSKRFFIVFALIMAGLFVPLTSALISRIAGPMNVEAVLKEEAIKQDITIKKVLRSGSSEEVVLELTIESAEPVSDDTLRILRHRAEQELNAAVKLKVRTLLVREL